MVWLCPMDIATFYKEDNMAKNRYLMTLAKPIKFEGEEYKEIDFSGFRDLTTKDLMQAERYGNGDDDILWERNIGVITFLASKSSGIPMEFFERLPISEGLRLRNFFIGFFYVPDSTEESESLEN